MKGTDGGVLSWETVPELYLYNSNLMAILLLPLSCAYNYFSVSEFEVPHAFPHFPVIMQYDPQA